MKGKCWVWLSDSRVFGFRVIVGADGLFFVTILISLCL